MVFGNCIDVGESLPHGFDEHFAHGLARRSFSSAAPFQLAQLKLAACNVFPLLVSNTTRFTCRGWPGVGAMLRKLNFCGLVSLVL